MNIDLSWEKKHYSYHMGFKKVNNEYIVVLKIPNTSPNNEARKDVIDKKFAKFRCKFAEVVRIYHKDTYHTLQVIQNAYFRKKITYRVGQIVAVGDYDANISKICAPGIHYFLSMQAAHNFNNNTGFVEIKNYDFKTSTDTYDLYHHNGYVEKSRTFNHREQREVDITYYPNGVVKEKIEKVHGFLDNVQVKKTINDEYLEFIQYNKGKLHGVKYIFDRGVILEMSRWIMGVKHGRRLFLDDDDKYKEEFYDKGFRVPVK